MVYGSKDFPVVKNIHFYIFLCSPPIQLAAVIRAIASFKSVFAAWKEAAERFNASPIPPLSMGCVLAQFYTHLARGE